MVTSQWTTENLGKDDALRQIGTTRKYSIYNQMEMLEFL